MHGVVDFAAGVWNYLVSIAPTILHAACQLGTGAETALKVTTGGGA